MRERASSKNLDGKTRLGAAQLRAGAALDGDADMMDEEQAKKEDIILVKESGKFMINDLELLQMQSKQAGKKRMRIETAKESDDDQSSVGDNVSDESSDADEDKKKMRNATKRQRTSDQGNFKTRDQSKKRFAKKKEDDGHFVKYSANAYKSAKGEGDTLKAGKYEPFAYIQLNPKMLNKRYKTKAIQSFEGIVSHGKKINKRKGAIKQDDGMLSGIGFKK